MSFYIFIAISLYQNIVCKNIVCELGLRVPYLPFKGSRALIVSKQVSFGCTLT